MGKDGVGKGLVGKDGAGMDGVRKDGVGKDGVGKDRVWKDSAGKERVQDVGERRVKERVGRGRQEGRISDEGGEKRGKDKREGSKEVGRKEEVGWKEGRREEGGEGRRVCHDLPGWKETTGRSLGQTIRVRGTASHTQRHTLIISIFC